jgi:hypothetical protein
MKMTIESTSRMVRVNGIECRVWEGVTERGASVQALIPRVAAHAHQDLSEFEAELQEHKPPAAAVQAFPANMVL